MPATHTPPDQPYADPTAYGNGPDDSVADTTENAAITHHVIALGGRKIDYTATAGHLVTVDPSSSKPTAKIFYVAFTADAGECAERGRSPSSTTAGPGSSSVFVLLGSFAPTRIKTALPDFTPPAPVHARAQPGQPARQERPGLHQPGRHRLLGRDRSRTRTRTSGASTRTRARCASSSSAT